MSGIYFSIGQVTQLPLTKVFFQIGNTRDPHPGRQKLKSAVATR